MSLDLVIFDMDGVITDTATVHADAWKSVFDAFLKQRAQQEKSEFVEFDRVGDYLTYVDGNPRYVGVKNFLQSRGIILPQGHVDDKSFDTICGVGNSKDKYFFDLIESGGVTVFEDTLALIENLVTRKDIKMAVASSSKNCKFLLDKAGLSHYFIEIYDGIVSAERGFKGKPHPDMFKTLMADLSAAPESVVILEDAISGVQAAKASGAGLTVGLDRVGQGLDKHGANIVVSDLKGVTGDTLTQWYNCSGVA